MMSEMDISDSTVSEEQPKPIVSEQVFEFDGYEVVALIENDTPEFEQLSR